MALLQPGFQNAPITIQPAIGQSGDFWGVNPRATVDAGQQTLVAPAAGLIVGNFAFVTPGSYAVTQGWTTGQLIGFLGRRFGKALITTYLAQAGSILNGGFGLALFSRGDFLAQFLGGSTGGQKVYADAVTGGAISAASAPGASSVTATIGAAGWTGVAVAGVLTVSGSGTGILSVGDTITGTGVPAGTTIGSLGTGTGGTGTYNLLNSLGVGSSVAFGSATIGTTSNVVNVTAVGSGALVPGVSLISANLPAPGNTLASQLTGTAGSTGTYTMTGAPIYLASGTYTTVAPVLTNWIVTNTVTAGQIGKITTWGN